MADLVTLATPMTDVLLGWFAETTLVALALAALAALLSRVPRLAPRPAARHALWLMVMLKLVTPPLLHWPWSVPLPVATIRPGPGRPAGVTARPEVERVAIAFEADSIPIDALPPEEIAPTAEIPAFEPAFPDPPTPFAMPSLSRSPGVWVVSAWLIGSIALVVGQAWRVTRFRRLLFDADPAPAWLVEEAEEVGRHLRVRVPAILVVPRLGTPVLWCLGRPVLLVPAKLLQTLEAGRWRAIVAHELAHLRRGDHWVRRLQLAAGLAWWWNPLYWLARHRLDFEAELACDAWAVWALPKDRISYAESLIRICTALSPARTPSPALGVAGTGRSFERRLTMILRDQVDRRVSAPGLLAASLLAALALPSWTLAAPSPEEVAKVTVVTTTTEPIVARFEPIVTRIEPIVTRFEPTVTRFESTVPQVVVYAVRDDEDDEKPRDRASSTAKDKEKAAKLKAERDQLRKKKEAIDKEMAEKFGPDSDFARKMEAFGKEMEGKFGPGSDFVKKMEALGEEMEAKFGPGSEFAKEIERKFGPGSEFAKEMEAKFGPDSEFVQKFKGLAKDGDEGDAKADARKAKLRIELKAKARADADEARGDAEKARSDAAKVRADALKAKLRAEAKARDEARGKVGTTTTDKRARRIETLESRINELKEELDRLKAESKDGDKDEEKD